MLRHIALFALHPSCTDSDLDDLVTRLNDLVRDCAEIKGGRVFTARQLGDGALAREFSVDTAQADIGVVLEFDSEEDWRAYAEGPLRRRLVAERMGAMVARRMSLQTTAW